MVIGFILNYKTLKQATSGNRTRIRPLNVYWHSSINSSMKVKEIRFALEGIRRSWREANVFGNGVLKMDD
jgi:hypothetical protein